MFSILHNFSLFQVPREMREGECEGTKMQGYGPLALSFAHLSRSLEQASTTFDLRTVEYTVRVASNIPTDCFIEHTNKQARTKITSAM